MLSNVLHSELTLHHCHRTYIQSCGCSASSVTEADQNGSPHGTLGQAIQKTEPRCCVQVRLWPLLGISPAMHNAGFAWIHFRQYVLTRHPGLISKTKALLKRLAQLAQQQQQQSQG